jgi:hypothetical protein
MMRRIKEIELMIFPANRIPHKTHEKALAGDCAANPVMEENGSRPSREKPERTPECRSRKEKCRVAVLVAIPGVEPGF